MINPNALVVPLPAESLSPVVLSDRCRPMPYHITAKRIAPEAAQKAEENKPFGDFLPLLGAERGAEEMASRAEDFLRATFPTFVSSGVSYSIQEPVDAQNDQEILSRMITSYRSAGLIGQAESVGHELGRLQGVRNAFCVMNRHGILKSDTVIPNEYLAEFLTAVPVWFIEGKKQLPDNNAQNDPLPDEAVKFICKSGKTQLFADFYQMYNRRTRPLSQFRGRDIMPLPIVEVLTEARGKFDYLVIATPYHDIASREWADPSWQRNIDPFLLGFIEGLPMFFVLGRWSGGGVFPLFLDMVADTMNHLQKNLNGLLKFGESPYWFGGEKPFERSPCSSGQAIKNAAETLLQSYRQNSLFETLRFGQLKT